MSGFVPMDAAWWPFVRDGLPKPWPREAAMMDLRWHVDAAERREGKPASEVVPFPGRPTLVARWGWTDWAVKQLMKGEAWVDRWTRDVEADGCDAQPPPADRQRAASAPPAADTTNADNPEETASAPPARRQPTATRVPCTQDTRHPTPVQTHTPPADAGPRVQPEPPAVAPKPDPLADPWRRLVAFTPAPDRWKLTPKRRSALAARLKEHGAAAVDEVIAWVCDSAHERARFLRERGDPDTLIRPDNFAKYLAFAGTPGPAPPAPSPTPQTPPSLFHRSNPFGEPDASAPDPAPSRRGDLARTHPPSRPRQLPRA